MSQRGLAFHTPRYTPSCGRSSTPSTTPLKSARSSFRRHKQIAERLPLGSRWGYVRCCINTTATCHRSSSSIGRRDASCTKESRGYRAVFRREWHPAYLESCSWVRPNITGQVGSDATQPVIFFRWLDLTRPDPRAFVNVLTLPDPTRPDPTRDVLNISSPNPTRLARFRLTREKRVMSRVWSPQPARPFLTLSTGSTRRFVPCVDTCK